MKISHYSLLAASRAAGTRIATRARRAFSLVEMLTVIGIIGILGIAIGGALSGGGSSAAAMNNAQRSIAGLFQMARAQAVMKGVPTAVIFYKRAASSADTDPAKYLRFMGIVYQDGSTWKPLNRGTYLPKGVYYVPPPNEDDFGSGNGSLGIGSSVNSLNTNLSASFPIPGSAANADRWYGYIFEPNGNLSGNNTYVLIAPSETVGAPVGGIPNINKDIVGAQMSGVAIRKSGGTVVFDGYVKDAFDGFEGGN